ncbi:hypothetical protein [Solibacillus sp. FSL K6-1523]|uniref:hypothetical protein n=1 Tax=Solibacillus sp. FSL K6-1523 TaxID=2921471 RepID=UPI0030F79572
MNNPTLYGFVKDPNIQVDAFGLYSTFPADPNNFTKLLGVDPSKVFVTKDGTIRSVWEPDGSTKIRFESHTEGICSIDPNWNLRHHGENYNVETKPNDLTLGGKG